MSGEATNGEATDVRLAPMTENVRVVASEPGVRTWTVNSLRHRIEESQKSAVRLRRSYRTSKYRNACELLALIDDQAVRACEAMLKVLGA